MMSKTATITASPMFFWWKLFESFELCKLLSSTIQLMSTYRQALVTETYHFFISIWLYNTFLSLPKLAMFFNHFKLAINFYRLKMFTPKSTYRYFIYCQFSDKIKNYHLVGTKLNPFVPNAPFLYPLKISENC